MIDRNADRPAAESQAIGDAFARPTTLCAFCPKMCTTTCPVSAAEGRETVTPWSKMSLVHLARSGQATLSAPAERQAIEACTGCGACVEKCAHGNPVAETLFAARGAAQSPRAARFRAAFEQTGDVKRRDHAAALDGLPRDRAASVAYFPGCARATVDGAAAIRKDLRALSRALDHDVPVCDVGSYATGRAQCCGYPLYADGQLDLLDDNFRRLADVLRGHDVVVTPDPGCAYMLSTVRSALAGQHGGQADGSEGSAFPTVAPLVEVLAKNVDQFAGAARGRVVRYHDACYLGRRGRTFDAPRRLLLAATGKPPLELVRHHDEGGCSGSGGLYPTSNPDGARGIAEGLVRENTDADDGALLVTACPSARRGFERAGGRVVDVVDVILGELP
jgi:Fe-S oxidoreductase